MKCGRVYLVGAGPGDPDLVSVRAVRILECCDVVVYDSLVPDEIIVTLPREVERCYVGKMSGQHSMEQDDINELLVEQARKGKTVVRLKGGDPFVFGRGGEEAEFLRRNNIPFEIVPGITAGTAAPEYAGIPLTDRRKSSFVMFITGHKAVEKSFSSVPWEWVGKSKNGTLVIFMGVAETETIARKLLDAGMDPSMPAAVIERGTFPTQRVVTTNLAGLPEKVREHDIKSPSVFVISEVAEPGNTIPWLKDKPLLGVRVMVTRPADQARPLYRSLRDLGAEVLPYPTIATQGHRDPAAWERIRTVESENGWIVFTSENGVRYFVRQWQEQFGDIRGLSGYRIAAVGEGTARALRSFLLAPDFVPTVATTAELASQMAAGNDLSGTTVVRVRGNLADDHVEASLESAGAVVLPLRVYRTYTTSWTEDRRKKLFSNPPDVILFSSGSTVEGFAAGLTKDELENLVTGATVVSIGPSTSQTIRSFGITVDVEAEVHTIPGMLDSLIDLYHNSTE